MGNVTSVYRVRENFESGLVRKAWLVSTIG